MRAQSELAGCRGQTRRIIMPVDPMSALPSVGRSPRLACLCQAVGSCHTWPVDGSAYVEIERDANRWRDRARAYRVLVDGTEAGKVLWGSTWRLSVPPGGHRVRLAMDWARSPEVEFDVQPGETACFRCGPNAGSWRILYDGTIGRRRYISLTRR
jgi:hypothetical protein